MNKNGNLITAVLGGTVIHNRRFAFGVNRIVSVVKSFFLFENNVDKILMEDGTSLFLMEA